jgi:hypothetical protein
MNKRVNRKTHLQKEGLGVKEANDWLGSKDGDEEATTKDSNESTSKCTRDRGDVDSPNNSCRSGMKNITGATGAMTSKMLSLSSRIVAVD